MNLNKFRIAALSREPSFLLRTVLWIIIPGMVIAFVIGLCRTGSSGKPIAEGGAEKVAINSRSECYKLLESVRQRQRLVESLISQVRGGEKDLVKKLAPDADVEEGRKYLRPDELQTYIDYSLKMMFFRRMDTEGLEPFAKAAAADPVSGFNCSMYGDLLRASGEYESAFAAYERGAADAETGADCRRRALSLCVRREWKSRLQNFYSKPEWREAVLDMDAGNEDRYMTVVAAGDWRGVLIEIGHNVWQRLGSPVWILMSVLTGTLWFLVIHVGAAIPVRLWWRGLLGFGFGLLSIPVTHLLNTAQEVWLDAPEHGAVLSDMFYCISGIGLREELAKLFMFVPMLFLLKRATVAEALAVAACVGLGFAALENVDYFNRYEATAVWDRFVMANFLHFALTGLTGLALWQAVRNSAWLTHFAWIFVGAVVFHGLWDYSPSDLRAAGDFRYFKIGGLAALALYFFRELCRYTQPKPGVPSAVFVYLAGASLMLSALISVTAWKVGFRQALLDTYQPVLASFIIGAALFYELRKA